MDATQETPIAPAKLRLADGTTAGKFGAAQAPAKEFSWRDKAPHRLREVLRYQPAGLHDLISRLYEHPCCGADGVFTAYNGGHLDEGKYPEEFCECLRLAFQGTAHGNLDLFECCDGWRYSYHISRWLAHRSPKPIQPGDLHNSVGGNHSIALFEQALPSRAAVIARFKASALWFLTQYNQTVLDHPDTKQIAEIINSWNP